MVFLMRSWNLSHIPDEAAMFFLKERKNGGDGARRQEFFRNKNDLALGINRQGPN